MKSVCIIGAGSAGTHLAHACSELGINVRMTDKAEMFFSRVNALWQQRYGEMAKNVLCLGETNGEICLMGSDFYIIATPPDTHLEIARKICEIEKRPKILIEKPLCLPGETAAFDALDADICVNYNHLFSTAWWQFWRLDLLTHRIPYYDGEVEIVINWKESADYIKKAHPWVENWEDSYLFDLARGGGCAMEHSHGLACLFDLLQQHPVDHNIHKNDVEHSYMKLDMKGILVTVTTDFTSDKVDKSVLCRRGEFWKKIWFDEPKADWIECRRNGGVIKMDFAKTRPLEFRRGVEGALAQWNGDKSINTYEIAKKVVETIG